jgi:hypothetical protein
LYADRQKSVNPGFAGRIDNGNYRADCQEEAFRFNNRKVDDASRFRWVTRDVVGRKLTYAALTKKDEVFATAGWKVWIEGRNDRYNALMSDQHGDHERRRFPCRVVFFFALPALYVFSSGPTWCLTAALRSDGDLWLATYWPLIKFSEIVGHKALVSEYVTWWAKLFGFL